MLKEETVQKIMKSKVCFKTLNDPHIQIKKGESSEPLVTKFLK